MTPSKLRKEGREAYIPGADPMVFQPFKPGSHAYNFSLEHWLDGWYEAEQLARKAEEEREEELEELEAFAEKVVDALEQNPLLLERLKELLDNGRR